MHACFPFSNFPCALHKNFSPSHRIHIFFPFQFNIFSLNISQHWEREQPKEELKKSFFTRTKKKSVLKFCNFTLKSWSRICNFECDLRLTQRLTSWKLIELLKVQRRAGKLWNDKYWFVLIVKNCWEVKKPSKVKVWKFCGFNRGKDNQESYWK